MIIPSYCLKLLRIFLLLFSPSTLTSSQCWTYPPPPPCPPARSSSLGSRRRGGTSSPTWSTGCTSYPHLGHQLGQHCQQPGNPHHVEPSAHNLTILSENNYVSSLQRLVSDYRKPLEETQPPILSQAKVDMLHIFIWYTTNYIDPMLTTLFTL